MNFWSPTCKPCLEELPEIKSLRNTYADSLEVISVGFARDSLQFVQFLKKYEMNWINVFEDEQLTKKYGGASALPQVFLIDTKGTIIYNRGKDFANTKMGDAKRLSLRETLMEKLGDSTVK